MNKKKVKTCILPNPEKGISFFNRAMGAEEQGESDGGIGAVSEVSEAKTSRTYQHITTDKDWAIVSPYRSEYSLSENKERMASLKKDVRALGYGFIQLVSRWVDSTGSYDEESLFIPNMQEKHAIQLGEKYEQSSVIVKDELGCYEICTTPFDGYDKGEVVRTFNVSDGNVMNISDATEIFARRKGGPASKPVNGNRAFQLKEVFELEEPGASYFGNSPRRTTLYRCNPKISSSNGSDTNSSVTESTKAHRVKRALFGDPRGIIMTFGIISAENPRYVDGEKVPDDVLPFSAEENNKRTERLIRMLKAMGIHYTSVVGSYGGKEHSFVLYSPSEADMLDIARKFGQESFFFGVQKDIDRDRHTEIFYYLTENGNDYDIIDSSDRIADARDLEDFFTRVGDFKFNIAMSIFEEELKNIHSINDFYDSINSNLTGKQRMEHRFLSRKNRTTKEPKMKTIDIREKLNTADLMSDNQYDLLNRYFFAGLDESKKKEFAKFLMTEGKTPAKIDAYMTKYIDGDTFKSLNEEFSDSSSEYILTTTEEILAGSVGNMGEEELDDAIGMFRFVSRHLPNSPKLDKITVLVTDYDYSADNYSDMDWNREGFGARHNNAYGYTLPNGIHLIEEVIGGTHYLYFATEDDAKAYVNYIDSINEGEL